MQRLNAKFTNVIVEQNCPHCSAHSDMVKQAVLWLLVVLFGLGGLFPGTDIEEVAKLPALVAHYYEHETQQGQQSFLSFLDEHYGLGSKHKESGKHDHDGLPLVKHEHHLGIWTMPELSISLVPITEIISLQVPKNGQITRLTDRHVIEDMPRPPRA